MRTSISLGSLQSSPESSPNILKHNKNPLNKRACINFDGVLDGNWTHNLLIRNQMRYPVAPDENVAAMASIMVSKRKNVTPKPIKNINLHKQSNIWFNIKDFLYPILSVRIPDGISRRKIRKDRIACR